MKMPMFGTGQEARRPRCQRFRGAREEAVMLAASMPRIRHAVLDDPNADDSPTAIGPALDAPRSEGGIASSHHRLHRPGARRLPWLLVSVAAVAGTVVAVFIFSAPVRRATAVAPPSSQVAAEQPPSVASAPVVEDAPVLRIENLPEDARVFANEVRVDLPLKLKRDDTVRVRVEAEGRVPWEQTVVAEGNVKLVYSALGKPKAPPRPTSGYKDAY